MAIKWRKYVLLNRHITCDVKSTAWVCGLFIYIHIYLFLQDPSFIVISFPFTSDNNVFISRAHGWMPWIEREEDEKEEDHVVDLYLIVINFLENMLDSHSWVRLSPKEQRRQYICLFIPHIIFIRCGETKDFNSRKVPGACTVNRYFFVISQF